MKTLSAFLIAGAVIGCLIGLGAASQATAGVAVIGIAAALLIVARMAQAAGRADEAERQMKALGDKLDALLAIQSAAHGISIADEDEAPAALSAPTGPLAAEVRAMEEMPAGI